MTHGGLGEEFARRCSRGTARRDLKTLRLSWRSMALFGCFRIRELGVPVEWVAHGATVEITIASHLGTATSSQQLVDSLNIEQRAKV